MSSDANSPIFAHTGDPAILDDLELQLRGNSDENIHSNSSNHGGIASADKPFLPDSHNTVVVESEEALADAVHELVDENCFQRSLRSFKRFTNKVVPPGGHASNIFNFASGTLGIGIVSMASGFNSTGIVLSAILMTICGCMVVFSFYLLGKTVELSDFRYDSWELACRHIFFRGADYLLSGFMIFFQFGTMVGFVIAAHELIFPFLNDESVSPFLRTPTGHRLLTSTVWLFGMFTMCIPRRVASLRYLSIVGVTFVVFFVFAVVARSSLDGLPHVHEMHLFSTGLGAVNGLSLFIFAFLSHGLALRTAKEAHTNHMKRRIRAVGVSAAAKEPRFQSGRMLAIDSTCSVAMVGTLYFVVGFFGYAYVGPTISGSIFKYFDVRNDAMMCVAYVGILLKICVAYALSNQACRLPIYYILRREVDTAPLWLHGCVTVVVCVASLALGLFVPDINIVFNLLGSICGGVLAFLLPVFFVCYLGGWTRRNVGLPRLLMSGLNLVAGVVAIVFGTAVTIDDMVKKYG